MSRTSEAALYNGNSETRIRRLKLGKPIKSAVCSCRTKCCEGNFIAEDITLVGAFVANSVSSAGSAMRMSRVNLVSVPTKTELTIGTRLDAKFFEERMGGWAGLSGSGWRFQSEALMTDFLSTPFDESSPLKEAKLNASTAKIVYYYQGVSVEKQTFIRRLEGRVPLPPIELRPEGCRNATTWSTYVACAESEVLGLIREAILKANETYRNSRSKTEEWEFSVDLNRFVSIQDRVRSTLWETHANQ